MRASCYPRLQLLAICSSAVSRYKVEPAPVVIPGYLRFFGQRRESGFITGLVVIQGAETPAKTVTSLLIIPSVLANEPLGTTLSRDTDVFFLLFFSFIFFFFSYV
jgi:hypothetical protein